MPYVFAKEYTPSTRIWLFSCGDGAATTAGTSVVWKKMLASSHPSLEVGYFKCGFSVVSTVSVIGVCGQRKL